MKIMLDPGHGMGNRKPNVYDPGTIGINGAREADYALLYANALKEKLEALGAQVSLTRKNNSQPCSLAHRRAIASSVGAQALISIHFNADATAGDSAPDGKIKGFQVLWRTPKSEALGQAVVRGFGGSKYHGSPLIERPDLSVLRYEPSVLIEFGFLDDPEDFALINDNAWRDKVAGGIAAALVDHFQKGNAS